MSVQDISRFLFDSRMRYSGARAQQGRAWLDSDANEAALILDEDRRRSVAETVCTGGTPNDGFGISDVRLADKQIWRPSPAAPPIAGDVSEVAHTYDFRISPGSYYLGGMRIVAEDEPPRPGPYAAGAPLPTTQQLRFLTQPDWLTLDLGTGKLPPTPPVGGTRTDLVGLLSYEAPVTAREDQETIEVGLGGPDTGTRMRRMWRVFVIPDVGNIHCSDAFEVIRTRLFEHAGNPPLAFDPELSELKSPTQMRVTFTGDPPSDDPCRPKSLRGYVGPENQTLRVQSTSIGRVVWGIDNASPLYRVTVSADGREVTMLTKPRDCPSMPTAGQVVEIIPWGAKLVNMEKAANEAGYFAVVAHSYDPTTGKLTLEAPVPPSMLAWLQNRDAARLVSARDPDNAARYFYMRVWTGSRPVGQEHNPDFAITPGALDQPPGPPVALAQAHELRGTGLKVQFSDMPVPTDHFIIAARPNTPDLVVPWRLLDRAPPSGIRRFVAPLALIKWTDQVPKVHDCREHFKSLCRIESCCTVTVGDGQDSFGDTTSIQDAIERLPPEGGHVCILRGTYDESIRIGGKRNVVIHGCGPETLIRGRGHRPAFFIEESAQITIRTLAIQAPSAQAVLFGDAVFGVTLDQLVIQVRDTGAIVSGVPGRAFGYVRDLTIMNSFISAQAFRQSAVAGFGGVLEPLISVAGRRIRIELNRITALGDDVPQWRIRGGVQIRGESGDVEIRRNIIAGGNGNGITLGSVSFVQAPGDDHGHLVEGVMAGRRRADRPVYELDPDGCLRLPTHPRPDNPDIPDPVPVSDGDLADVRIIENRISEMGSNGIAVEVLFFDDRLPDIIEVDDLLIWANRIEGCRTIPQFLERPSDAYDAAFGGIILGAGDNTVIRDNLIEGIGQRLREPSCGIFYAQPRGAVIEGNIIGQVGAPVDEIQDGLFGFRGGIWLFTASVPPAGRRMYAKEANPERGQPAAVVRHNRVMAARGRALFIAAYGPAVVSGNQFGGRRADLAALIPVLQTFLDERAAAGGIPTPRLRRHALALAAEAIGGDAVFIAEFAVPIDVASHVIGPGKYYTNQLGRADAKRDKVMTKLGARPIDFYSMTVPGAIAFEGNQVTCDAADGRSPFATYGSVVLISADDVLMANNHIDARFYEGAYSSASLAVGVSVRATGNRFVEIENSVAISCLSLARLANATGLNHATHCIIDVVAYPALQVIGRPHVHIGDRDAINLHLNVELLDYLSGEGKRCSELRQMVQTRAEDLIKELTGILQI